MILSHKRRFIYIHIHKTAGTSLSHILLPHARLQDRAAYEFLITRKTIGAINRVMGWADDGNRWFTGFHKHAAIRDVQERLDPALFNDYFKFAFVRNPFDWLVSIYFYIRASKSHRLNRETSKMTFEEFVRNEVERGAALQRDYLVDHNGCLLMDYVGRFETLEADMKHINQILGLPQRPIPRMNVTTQRPSRDYCSLYTDPQTIALVERHFADDLALFGYTFAGPEAACLANRPQERPTPQFATK